MARFFATSTFVSLIPGLDAAARRRRRTHIVSRFCSGLLAAFDIDVAFAGTDAGLASNDRGRLIIANHISYLDVCLIGAVFPAVFVTSVEVKETKGLNVFTRMAGCLYVERRKRTSVVKDIDAITTLLNEGLDVVVFPEGTTSDGSHFLDFKKSLLESALRCRSQVTALCLKYESVDGEPFGGGNADKVAWYGDMTFMPHFKGLLRTRGIEARVEVLGSVPFRGHRCRKRLAATAKEMIAAAYFTA